MIIIENVTKKYGDFTAVDNISLKVEPGEFYGFLGPNGAGKTTTIKMLAGILLPTSGKMIVDGTDIVENPVEAKFKVGFIPDKPFVYEKLTGGEYLEFVADLYKIPMTGETLERKKELLSLFRLEKWENELVESYSHGMRQKLVITSVLLHRPKVIVVDEPMVGLDAKGAMIVKRLMREEAERGTTIFMSTHTMVVAQELCGRIGIIRGGRIVAEGTMEELRKTAHSGAMQLEEIFLTLTEEQEEEQALRGE